MIKDYTIRHSCGNQYYMDDHCFYDTELLVYTYSLVECVKKTFGVIIPLNEDVCQKALYYCGKSVYGNIQYPVKMYVKSTWCDKWELLKIYNYDNVNGCCTTYGDYTKEEIINIANVLAEYVNNNDVLTQSFLSNISYYDMKYICNAYDVAVKLIRYYKQFVDIKDGVTEFLKIVSDSHYRIAEDKLSNDMFIELKLYGLI